MTPERIKHFSKMSLEKISKLTYKDFTTSEIEEIIAETPMKDDDKRIALWKFIRCMTVDEIATKLWVYDTSNMNKRIKSVRKKLVATCIKLFLREEDEEEEE